MKISLKHSEKLHFIGATRSFTDIHIDEPESFHGTDKGPSSVEYFLIGIGGCVGSTFSYCLQKNSIDLEDLEVLIDAKIKHKGQKFKLMIDSVDIELKFTPKPDQDREKIQSCLADFKQHCVINNSIQEGFPINIQTLEK